eukprot:GGOE01001676.1.p1 GENE.GGOE01001676.1~~GGOE01001676.1.p1  ORF type:complete len:261 (+),score=70.74 GGOE01001676.1:71-853(+)
MDTMEEDPSADPPTEFGVQHSIQQLNDHLASYSLPPLLLGPNVDVASAASAVRCVHSLLLQRQREIVDREEISGTIRRAKTDLERYQRQHKKLEERFSQLQSEAATLRQQQAQREQDQRQQREALQASVSEAQRLNAQLLFKEHQLTQRSSHQEKECGRLTEKVNGLLRDKSARPTAARIEVLNDGICDGSQRQTLRDPIPSLQQRAAEAGESRYEECREEVQTLRRVLPPVRAPDVRVHRPRPRPVLRRPALLPDPRGH